MSPNECVQCFIRRSVCLVSLNLIPCHTFPASSTTLWKRILSRFLNALSPSSSCFPNLINAPGMSTCKCVGTFQTVVSGQSWIYTWVSGSKAQISESSHPSLHSKGLRINSCMHALKFTCHRSEIPVLWQVHMHILGVHNLVTAHKFSEKWGPRWKSSLLCDFPHR